MPIRPIDPAKRGLRPVTAPAGALSPTKLVTRPKAVSTTPPPSAAAPPAADATDAKIVLPGPAKRAHHKVDRTTDNWDENGDYIVGKGRPPRRTQWQPGQSGNPAGPKPKEVVDPQTRLDRHILADFTVRQNGEEVTLSMGEFAINTLKANAAKGVTKAQLSLFEIYAGVLRRQAAAAGDTPEVAAWEQHAVDTLLDQLGLPPVPVVRAERDRSGDDGDGA